MRANQLTMNGMNFTPIKVSGSGRNPKRLSRIILRGGGFYIGTKSLYNLMMDDSVYYKATLRKLDIYEKNDILLGRDLLVFHETGKRALNMKNVDKYIQQYLV